MVSEKVIVILIIVAILLSVVSIVVTMSSVSTKMIPKINVNQEVIPDVEDGQVSLVVNPQTTPPEF